MIKLEVNMLKIIVTSMVTIDAIFLNTQEMGPPFCCKQNQFISEDIWYNRKETFSVGEEVAIFVIFSIK